MKIDDSLTVEEAVALLEVDLGISPGFLTHLVNEDDWSFIVKSHAFLEAAISHLLADSLSEPALQAVFANTETSNSRSGKLAFLKTLDLLNEDARRFIRSFSELRNSLVHEVSQVDFNFTTHLKSLDKQQTDKFVKAFGYFANGSTFERNGDLVDTRSFLLKNPKQGLWYSVMALCGVIYLSKDFAKLRRLNRSLQLQVSEASSLGNA
jgi:hypothetical protein